MYLLGDPGAWGHAYLVEHLVEHFEKSFLNKNIKERIICIYNNDIAAARVELWSSSTNEKYAESSSTNYILCEKPIKV